MRKIKRADGTIVEVDSDYQLKDGEQEITDKDQTDKSTKDTKGGDDDNSDEGGDDDEVVSEVKNILNDRVKVAVEDLKKEVREELEEKVKEFVDRQKEIKEKKAGIYHRDIEASQKAKSEKIKAHIGMALGKTYDVSEEPLRTTADSDGGYLVDEELDAEIRHLTKQYGVARQEFFTTPMSKTTWKGNELNTDVASAWVDEGAEYTTSSIGISQKSLTLGKLGVIVAVTNELLNDSEIDLSRFVTERVAEEFSSKEDAAALVGDGSSSYGSHTGIMNDSDVNTYTISETTYDGVTPDDILSARAKIPGDNVNIKIICHRTVKDALRKQKDSNGNYILENPANGNEVTRVWSYPIVESRVMPSTDEDNQNDSAFMIVGDLNKACILGYKGGFSVEEFRSGTIQDTSGSNTINLLTTDRRAIRFKERVGFVNILPEAVCVLYTAVS